MSAAAEIAYVSSELDIFAHRPIHTSVLGTTEVAYKPIAPFEQNDLVFLTPADYDTYIHTLFSQGNVALNGVNITHVSKY